MSVRKRRRGKGRKKADWREEEEKINQSGGTKIKEKTRGGGKWEVEHPVYSVVDSHGCNSYECWPQH